MHDQASGRRVPALVHPLIRNQRGVRIDLLEVVRDAAVGVVLQLTLEERGCSAREPEGFVYAQTIPAPGTTIVEAELVVGEPVGRPDPATQVLADAADAITTSGGLLLKQCANLARQLRRDALVGVHRQDPVVAGLVGGEVLLLAVSRPVA